MFAAIVAAVATAASPKIPAATAPPWPAWADGAARMRLAAIAGARRQDVILVVLFMVCSFQFYEDNNELSMEILSHMG